MNIRVPLNDRAWPKIHKMSAWSIIVNHQNDQNECLIETSACSLHIYSNASKHHQIPNTQSKFIKSYRRFKNNMNNLQYNFQNFPPSIHCTEIAITTWFTPKQVSLLQKFITFILGIKWRLKTPICKDQEVF